MNETGSIVVDIYNEEQLRKIMSESTLAIIGVFNRHSSFDAPWIKFLLEFTEELAELSNQGGIFFAKVYVGDNEAGNELWEKAELSSSASFILIKNGEIKDSFSACMYEEEDVKFKFLSWIWDAGMK